MANAGKKIFTWTLVLPAIPNRLDIPAFLTAAETAFTAVCRLLNSCEKSPETDRYIKLYLYYFM